MYVIVSMGLLEHFNRQNITLIIRIKVKRQYLFGTMPGTSRESDMVGVYA